MSDRILGPSGSRRRRFWRGRFIFLLVIAIGAAGLIIATASAVHDTGAFELDGNAASSAEPAATAPDDWDRVCHEATEGAVDCSTDNDTNGATAVAWTPEPNLQSSIFTGGGSKDPQDISNWLWKDGAGGLPDKDNLLHSFAARYSLPDDDDDSDGTLCDANTASTCEVLFFGSDRYDNSGDAQQGFWFFQNTITDDGPRSKGGNKFTGVHEEGDLLVISDFSNGGTTSTITVYKWNPNVSGNLELLATSDEANCATADAGDDFCGIVNPDTTASPWLFTDKSGSSSFLNGEFYEGGINLSALGLAEECFASVASETRSSTSTTATLKDFVLEPNFAECDVSTAQEWTPDDTATVGGTSAAGTMEFTLYDGDDCSGEVLGTFEDSTAPYRASDDVDDEVPTFTGEDSPVTISWSAEFTFDDTVVTTETCETSSLTVTDEGPPFPPEP